MMRKTRVGLVGYGRFGRIHVKALSQIPNAELAAVCAGSERSFQEAKNELGVPVFLDYSRFLRDADIDSVDIVTPNYTHAKLAREALYAGKNVYLEKPIATSLEEARKIADAQTRSKKILQIGFENRYSSFWKTIKTILERGDIGVPLFGKIDSWRFPLRAGSQNWKYDRQKVGHQLLEEAIHYVDLANWLFDTKPLMVSGFIDDQESLTTGHLKNAFFIIEFEKQKKVLITDNLQGFGSDLSFTISGENGTMTGAVRAESDDSENPESYLKLRDRNDKTSTIDIRLSGQLADLTAAMADFVHAVQTEGKAHVTVEDGFASLAICEAALESMKSGRTERVNRLV